MNSIFDDTIAGVKELLNSSLTTKADALGGIVLNSSNISQGSWTRM